MLQGGRLVQWMDTASAVCAQTHAERICATISLDKMNFKNPARVGDIITIKARLTRAFETSMEVFVQAWARKVLSRDTYLINEAYFTFVAMDDYAHPTKVPQLVPQTPEEEQHYEQALIRKEQRKK
jgi:acyl-CoA hydrolase